MRRYVDILFRLRWFIAIGVPLLVMLLSFSLKDLAFDGSYRIWFGENSQTLKSYDRFRSDFGNDDAVTIYFKDEKGIFTKKALSVVDELTDKLWHLKYVERVSSLTNYQYIHTDPKNPDDVLVDDFIEDPNTKDEQYFKKRKEIALKDESLLDSFISRDGKTTMIAARLVPDVNEDGDKSQEIMSLVTKLLEPIEKKSGYHFFVNGGPALNKAFIDIGTRDAVVFTPLVVFVSMLLLYILFRRVSGALLPVGVVVLTFVTVLSVQVLLGYKLNNFTANIPVFLVAIGIADALHLYSVWAMLRDEGVENKEAVFISLQKNILPIFLTSVTTSIGFATLMISSIVPVFTLGVATASGAILAFVISVVWLPSVLLLLNKDRKKHISKSSKNAIFKNYGSFIVSHDKKILIITTLIFVVMGLGLFRVKIDSNTIRYLGEDVPIRVATEFLMNNLTGPMAYEIVADSGRKGGVKDPKFLKTVERFCEDYKKRFPDVRHLYSLLDVIKRFNKELNFKDEVPNSHNLIAQYLLLYSMSIPQGMEITDKIDFDERKLRITAQVNIVDTSKDLEQIRYVQKWWSKTPYSAKVEGQTAMFAFMQNDVTNTLIYSLSLAILFVSVVMFFIFRKPKLIWIFLLPNLIPVVLVVGLMGWLDINIDIGVAIAGAIIIGVAVDDTIHFLVKYFDAQKRGLDLKRSFDEVIRYAGRAIIFTTLILSVSFSLFIFSDFNPNKNFGIVTALALIIALITDLFLLPALLSITKKI